MRKRVPEPAPYTTGREGRGHRALAEDARGREGTGSKEAARNPVPLGRSRELIPLSRPNFRRCSVECRSPGCPTLSRGDPGDSSGTEGARPLPVQHDAPCIRVSGSRDVSAGAEGHGTNRGAALPRGGSVLRSRCDLLVSAWSSAGDLVPSAVARFLCGAHGCGVSHPSIRGTVPFEEGAREISILCGPYAHSTVHRR